MHLSIQKETWFLILIFTLITISIFIKSYFNPDGYLSPDSSHYLSCAQNLIDGNGYYVSGYSLSGKEHDFFAIWPIGYPTAIYFISKVIGATVMWSSKLLNVFLIGIIFFVFYRLFKKNAYIYALLFFFASYIEIFAYTWSETLFITALIWFTASIYLFIEKPKYSNILYISIAISSQLLFLSRYIGAFSFGIIALLGIYYLIKKENSKFLILFGLSLLNISLMVMYLYHNYLEVGYPTGMPKVFSTETNLMLIKSLLIAFTAEITIPFLELSNLALIFLFLQLIIIIVIIIKYHKLFISNILNSKIPKVTTVFSIVGFIYLFFIILLRWFTHFDDFNFRLLAPGTLLLFIALISYILSITRQEGKVIFLKFFIPITLLSFLINVPVKTIKRFNHLTYKQTKEEVINKYQVMEQNSIIIFEPKHLRYIRPDIEIRVPFTLPYHGSKESFSHFLHRIDPAKSKNIYILIPNKLNPKRYHHSIVKLVSLHKTGSLVKIQ